MPIDNPLRILRISFKFFSTSTTPGQNTNSPRLKLRHPSLARRDKIREKAIEKQRKKDAAFEKQQKRHAQNMKKLKENAIEKLIGGGMAELFVPTPGLQGNLEDLATTINGLGNGWTPDENWGLVEETTHGERGEVRVTIKRVSDEF